jgi:hypothetical protein
MHDGFMTSGAHDDYYNTNGGTSNLLLPVVATPSPAVQRSVGALAGMPPPVPAAIHQAFPPSPPFGGPWGNGATTAAATAAAASMSAFSSPPNPAASDSWRARYAALSQREAKINERLAFRENDPHIFEALRDLDEICSEFAALERELHADENHGDVFAPLVR